MPGASEGYFMDVGGAHTVAVEVQLLKAEESGRWGDPASLLWVCHKQPGVLRLPVPTPEGRSPI